MRKLIVYLTLLNPIFLYAAGNPKTVSQLQFGDGSIQTTAATGSSAAGSNSNIQSKQAGVLYGDNGLQYDASVSSVTIGLGGLGSSGPFTFNNPTGSGISFNAVSNNPVLRLKTNNITITDFGFYFMDNFGFDFMSQKFVPATNGSYNLQISSYTGGNLFNRYQIARDTGIHSFSDRLGNTIVSFDPVHNASFTIPVAIPLISASSLATDSTGKIIAGSGGSGSGSVNSGTIGQNAYYAVNGTTVSGSSNMITNTSSETFNVTTNHLFGMSASTGIFGGAAAIAPMVIRGQSSSGKGTIRLINDNVSDPADPDISMEVNSNGVNPSSQTVIMGANNASGIIFRPVNSTVGICAATTDYIRFSENPSAPVTDSMAFTQPNNVDIIFGGGSVPIRKIGYDQVAATFSITAPTYFTQTVNVSSLTTSNTLSVNSTTLLNGSVGLHWRTVAVSTTAVIGDNGIAVSDTSSPRTVTLFSTSTCTGQNTYMLIVKDKSNNAATNNITIAAAAGEKIDLAATKVISTNLQSFTLSCQSDGWWTW